MTNPVHSVGGARVWQRIVSPHPDPLPRGALGERGQPPRGACFAHTRLPNSVAGIAQRQRTIHPLPRGEGRGEGKENVVYPPPP